MIRRAVICSSSTEPGRSARRSGALSAQISLSAVRFTRKGRNITDRLAAKHHAAVRRTLRQAWELDDADRAERLMRSLAQRFEQEVPDVSRSILEGLDEVLTVSRLGLPLELRRSLASTNIIESMNSTVRQVCRNVKRWRNTGMLCDSPPPA